MIHKPPTIFGSIPVLDVAVKAGSLQQEQCEQSKKAWLPAVMQREAAEVSGEQETDKRVCCAVDTC